MPGPTKSLTETLADIINAGKMINTTVTRGYTIPTGRGSELTFSMPNWEDPRLQFRIPASDPYGTNFLLTLGADLNWHDPIKAAAANAQNWLYQRLAGR